MTPIERRIRASHRVNPDHGPLEWRRDHIERQLSNPQNRLVVGLLVGIGVAATLAGGYLGGRDARHD